MLFCITSVLYQIASLHARGQLNFVFKVLCQSERNFKFCLGCQRQMLDSRLVEVAIPPVPYPPRGGTCVYFVKASSGGRPASSNASTPRFALSPLGIRDTDRYAPPCGPRIGRSSRRRDGLPPFAAPSHIIPARAMRMDGRSVHAWPSRKRKGTKSWQST